VVVGGGWAGFGAAKHLAEQGYAVTLLEASKNPGGLSGGELQLCVAVCMCNGMSHDIQEEGGPLTGAGNNCADSRIAWVTPHCTWCRLPDIFRQGC